MIRVGQWTLATNMVTCSATAISREASAVDAYGELIRLNSNRTILLPNVTRNHVQGDEIHEILWPYVAQSIENHVLLAIPQAPWGIPQNVLPYALPEADAKGIVAFGAMGHSTKFPPCALPSPCQRLG